MGVLLALCCLGCEVGPADSPRDAGLTDAGSTDAGSEDSGAPDAGPSCGCVSGEYCDATGHCRSDPAPVGGYCGVTDACLSTSPDFADCASDQCASRYCVPSTPGLVLDRSVCSRPCMIYQDSDLDGINDADAPQDDCGPSGIWDGPAGAAYRCVAHTDPGQSLVAYCVPGTDFLECNSTPDCPADEVCDLGNIHGEFRLRCYAPYRENSAWPSEVVRLGQTCNNDIAAGALIHCADGLCLDDASCSAFCADPTDCDTTRFDPAQRCVGLTCTNAPSISCATDLDCSTMECTGVLDLGLGPTFSFCEAKP